MNRIANDSFSGEVSTKLQLRTPFINRKPGKEWFWRLRIHHPELTLQKPEPIAMVRLRAINPTVVSNYFQELGQVLSALNLDGKKRKPQLIWNTDGGGGITV